MTGPNGIESRTSRRQSPSYIRQIHVELVILLIVICAAAAITGWPLRPSRWSSPLGVSAPTLRFSAINVSGTQHDTFRAFLSGIFFGIAGGSIITFLQELLVPFSRRRDALNAP
jgi:hypothetical protein